MKYLCILMLLCVYTISSSMKLIQSSNPSTHTQRCLEGVEKGDKKLVKNSLSQGADVNYKDEKNRCLFFIAYKAQNPEITKLIISHKNINISSSTEGITPLHIACVYGWTSVIKTILEKKYPTIKTKELEPRYKPNCISSSLITHSRNIIDWQNDYGNTPLHIACDKKSFKSVKLLIKYGANVTLQNDAFYTPLAMLYFHNSLDTKEKILRFFKKHKNLTDILIHATNKNNDTQLHLCIIMHPDNNNNLTQFKEYIGFLISMGCDIYAKNKDGKQAIDLIHNQYSSFYNQYSREDYMITPRTISCQEIMYHFLSLLSLHTPYALFTTLFNKYKLEKQIKAQIECLYYILNFEIIFAKKYIEGDEDYRKNFIYKKNSLRNNLLQKPEPHLLWSNPW